MKYRSYLMFLLMVLLSVSAGCGSSAKNEVKKAVSSELDLLENLDPDAAQKYISYEDLFPDAKKTSSLSPEIEEVFSLFFQDFDYKIMEVDVDKASKKASASVRLTTIDSRSLAKDFASAHLRADILDSVGSTDGSKDNTSMEEHYLLLGEILKENDYEKVETNCTVTLVQTDSGWTIQKDENLENELVGGLLTYLSDPNILTPSETVGVYMDTLKKMDAEELNAYLNLDSVLNSDDEQEKAIAAALVDQVHKCFDYKIIDETDHGYRAEVTLEIISFDSAAILKAYQKELDAYLDTPDAVIDGEEGRVAKSQEYLLNAIKANKSTSTSEVPVELVNDGFSWNMQMNNHIGKALFGNLSSDTASSVSDENLSEDASEDSDGSDYDETDYGENYNYGDDFTYE